MGATTNGAINMPFTTTTTLSDDQIRSLLVGALEGGSNYWYLILEKNLPPKTKIEDFVFGGKFVNPADPYGFMYIIPFHEGGGILIGDAEADDPYSSDAAFQPVLLNREAMQKGIQLMCEKHPKHFADVLAQNDDATTSDVFLQLSLLGEIIFG